MKKKTFLICIAILTISMSPPTAIGATVSLVPQLQKVILGDQIHIDIMLSSVDPIFRGALDFTYPSDLVNYTFFEMNHSFVEGSLSFLPNSSTPGLLDNFSFAIRSASDITAGRLATMIFTAGNTAGTADIDVLLETISVGPAWKWGQTGDLREFQPISASDLANFKLIGSSVEIQVVPIPSAIMLLGFGLISLIALRRRSSEK